MKRYQTIISIVVSLIVIFGAGFGAVSYFAKASSVHELKLVMNYNFLEVRAEKLQERMWAIEKQFGIDRAKWTQEARQKYKEYEEERKIILKKLEIIFKEQCKKGKG